VQHTAGSDDFYVERIPAGVLGQSYVLLSMDEWWDGDGEGGVVAGPAVLEVRFERGGMGVIGCGADSGDRSIRRGGFLRR